MVRPAQLVSIAALLLMAGCHQEMKEEARPTPVEPEPALEPAAPLPTTPPAVEQVPAEQVTLPLKASLQLDMTQDNSCSRSVWHVSTSAQLTLEVAPDNTASLTASGQTSTTTGPQEQRVQLQPRTEDVEVALQGKATRQGAALVVRFDDWTLRCIRGQVEVHSAGSTGDAPTPTAALVCEQEGAAPEALGRGLHYKKLAFRSGAPPLVMQTMGGRMGAGSASYWEHDE